MRTMTNLILTCGLLSQLVACVPAIVGGAAAGGAIAADRRTSGIYVEDENIELKAYKKMETNLGEDAHINTTSYNRNVLLTGEAPVEESKNKAASLVKEITNVRNITNEVTVGPKSSFGSRSNDTLITSKVKTKFVTENKFPANYVKVVTEHSVVYLLGIVTKSEGNDAADIASSVDGVSKVVKVFEYIE
ncbi:MAG: BON domain-containing protein [Methylophilaceae bacterium]